MKLGIIAFVLTISAVTLRLLTPPRPTAIPLPAAVSKNFDGSTSQFASLTYTGSLPDFPTELPIYITVSSERVSQNIVEGLIKKYQLKPHAVSKNIWLNGNYSLVKNPTLGIYVFNNSPQLSTSTPTANPNRETSDSQSEIINEAAAQTTGTQLVSDLGLANTYTLDPRKTRRMTILEGELEPEEDTSLNPNHVELQFSQKINGYEVQLESKNENYLKIIVNASQTITRVTFPIQTTEIKNPLTTEKILPISFAMETIKSGGGSIVNAVGEDLVPFDITTISKGALTAVDLEYRIDTANEVAYPAYRFTGTLTNTTGSIYSAQLLTPAVATQPISSPTITK